MLFGHMSNWPEISVNVQKCPMSDRYREPCVDDVCVHVQHTLM